MANQRSHKHLNPWDVPPVMVIDTSMTMRSFFEYELNRDAAIALPERIKEGNCIGVVPVAWGLEVADVLVMAVKRGKLEPEQMRDIKAQLTKLPFVSDSDTFRHMFSATLALAEKRSLRMADASFLELAQRLGAALGTDDKALFNAAVAEGVTVFPPQLPDHLQAE